MIEATPLRVGLAATIGWLLLWVLVFDQWFFWSPLGLLIVFGLPVAGWAGWWKFLRDEDREIRLADLVDIDKGAAGLAKLKDRFGKQK